MHDIMTREQVRVAKNDIMTRLAPKDKINEKLSNWSKRPQHSPDDDLHPFDGYVFEGFDVNILPEYDELTQFVDYSLPNKNNSQSGENYVGGEDKPTAEEKYFYGW